MRDECLGKGGSLILFYFFSLMLTAAFLNQVQVRKIHVFYILCFPLLFNISCMRMHVSGTADHGRRGYVNILPLVLTRHPIHAPAAHTHVGDSKILILYEHAF